MNHHERRLLKDLIGRVNNADTPEIDPEATARIESGIVDNSKALILLLQTALVQKLLILDQQSEIEGLKARSSGQARLVGTALENLAELSARHPSSRIRLHEENDRPNGFLSGSAAAVSEISDLELTDEKTGSTIS